MPPCSLIRMTLLDFQFMNKVSVKKSANGEGVFATVLMRAGELIMPFHGPLLQRDQLPYPYLDEDDHFVQIGEETFMGPSGGPDDFVNHSCNPNAGLKITSERIALVAIRDIQTNEEITWDYSTTMWHDDWELVCHCGESQCRKRVKAFRFLPSEVKERYRALGIVPQYVLQDEKG